MYSKKKFESLLEYQTAKKGVTQTLNRMNIQGIYIVVLFVCFVCLYI